MPPSLFKQASYSSVQPRCSNSNVTVVGRRTALASAASFPLLGMLMGPAVAVTTTVNKEVATEESSYIQELLRRTEEKKEDRKKERLEAYYKKNFKEYFEFEAGSVQAGRARGISDSTQKDIQEWLENNKD